MIAKNLKYNNQVHNVVGNNSRHHDIGTPSTSLSTLSCWFIMFSLSTIVYLIAILVTLDALAVLSVSNFNFFVHFSVSI